MELGIPTQANLRPTFAYNVILSFGLCLHIFSHGQPLETSWHEGPHQWVPHWGHESRASEEPGQDFSRIITKLLRQGDSCQGQWSELWCWVSALLQFEAWKKMAKNHYRRHGASRRARCGGGHAPAPQGGAAHRRGGHPTRDGHRSYRTAEWSRPRRLARLQNAPETAFPSGSPLSSLAHPAANGGTHLGLSVPGPERRRRPGPAAATEPRARCPGTCKWLPGRCPRPRPGPGRTAAGQALCSRFPTLTAIHPRRLRTRVPPRAGPDPGPGCAAAAGGPPGPRGREAAPSRAESGGVRVLVPARFRGQPGAHGQRAKGEGRGRRSFLPGSAAAARRSGRTGTFLPEWVNRAGRECARKLAPPPLPPGAGALPNRPFPPGSAPLPRLRPFLPALRPPPGRLSVPPCSTPSAGGWRERPRVRDRAPRRLLGPPQLCGGPHPVSGLQGAAVGGTNCTRLGAWTPRPRRPAPHGQQGDGDPTAPAGTTSAQGVNACQGLWEWPWTVTKIQSRERPIKVTCGNAEWIELVTRWLKLRVLRENRDGRQVCENHDPSHHPCLC